MRRLAFAACLAATPLAGCSKDAPPPERKAPPPRRQVKKSVDRSPLPGLAADPGGATGKPLWGVGFGGLGIDAPRGIAIGPGGDAYIVGYFDGETDLGAAGKHAATPNAKDPKKTGSDAFIVRLGPDGKIAWGTTFGAGRDDVANRVAVGADRL